MHETGNSSEEMKPPNESSTIWLFQCEKACSLPYQEAHEHISHNPARGNFIKLFSVSLSNMHRAKEHQKFEAGF